MSSASCSSSEIPLFTQSPDQAKMFKITSVIHDGSLSFDDTCTQPLDLAESSSDLKNPQVIAQVDETINTPPLVLHVPKFNIFSTSFNTLLKTVKKSYRDRRAFVKCEKEKDEMSALIISKNPKSTRVVTTRKRKVVSSSPTRASLHRACKLRGFAGKR